MPENEKGAFLTDLIGEYHREKNKQSLAKDFKKNKQKDVKAFLCALGLGDVLEAFKREKQGKNRPFLRRRKRGANASGSSAAGT